MRLIDADVLKQHIDKLPALPDGNFAGNHSALKALINMQPTIEPEQRWIPSSERLPSKTDHTDDMVLVCYRNGSVRFNTYMNGWVQGNPVAWMPLPEPYREGRWEE